MKLHRKVVQSVAAFALFTLATVAAQAQSPRGSWELGFAAGGSRFDFDDSEQDSGDGTELRAELRGGTFLTDKFALELQVARVNAPLEADLTTAMVNGVFHRKNDGPVIPYLLAGAGAARFERDPLFGSSGSSFEATRFAVQGGVGARFPIGERATARLELSALRANDPLDELGTTLSLTGGFSWRIGR
jgi:opacity protein-like surface antigen